MTMALHFSGEHPEDQFYTDFGNLNRFDDEPFSQLSTVVFNFLVAPQQSSHFLSQLEEFSSQYSLGLNALKNLVKSVLIISYLLLRSNS